MCRSQRDNKQIWQKFNEAESSSFTFGKLFMPDITSYGLDM